MRAIYNPKVFDVTDIESAKRIILTPEDATTAERWENETPYLADLLMSVVTLSSSSVLLDYGCGIGRMSKELLERSDCSVIGVDISANMRALAASYVGSDRFLACSPPMLDLLIERGLRVDAVLAVWVLQHCWRPAEDVARIARALDRDGNVFVVNQDVRAVPVRGGAWANDGLKIRDILSAELQLVSENRLDPVRTSPVLAERANWSVYRKPELG